jgi:sugar O-acyltransferase (sialic acid O-acetyltransferase NeuD family)
VKPRRILLLGGGGHCQSVLDALRGSRLYAPAGIIDKKGRVGEKVCGVSVVGTDADLEAFRRKGVRLACISLGSVGDPGRRRALAARARRAGFIFPAIVHPRAIVSPRASLGAGAFVAAGAVVVAGARVGDFCIVNTGAIVEHDCRLGEFVHLATGAALSGDVSIGERSHVGTGASVRQGARIGRDTVVGAGSAVVCDLPDRKVCYGNPCRARKDAV